MAAPVRIRIGAGLDASVEQAFSAYEKRAARAATNAQRELNKGYSRKTSGKAGAAAKAAADEEIQQARRAARVKEQIDKSSSRAALAEIRRQSREREREHKKLLDEVAREERKASRERERLARREARNKVKLERERQREIDRFAVRTSHRATRFMMPNMPFGSIARRGIRDITRGLGIDTSISGGLSRAVEMQKEAYALSIKGYQAGAEGPAGRRVDPRKLIEEARAIADVQAMDPTQIIAAQKAYVGLTGDLETARKLMNDLAALSGATGSEMADLGQAAGAMGNALDESLVPGVEKAKALMGVMRILAGQGKLTAIEMDTAAAAMPKMVGAARAFGGDVGQRIVELGALTQLSVGKGGGSWNAKSAATAAAGFAADLQSVKASKNFKAAGINLRDESGMLRGPLDLIRESLRVTAGDTTKMSKLFQSQRGGRMVNALTATYNRAGRGEAGMKAVDDMLQRLLKGAELSQEQIADLNRQRMQTAAAKAQKFQNQLDRIAESAAEKLIPALEKLIPTVLKLAENLSGLVEWAAEHPMDAIVLAFAAAIARAGIESTIRTGIDAVIKSALGAQTAAGGNAIKALTGASGALGAFSTALMAAAAGATAFAATTALLSYEEEKRKKGEEKAIITDVQTSVEIGTAEKISREKGGLSKEQYEKLKGIKEQLGSRIQEAENPAWFYQTFTQEGRNKYEQVQFDKQAANMKDLKDQMARVEQVLAQGIRVNNLNEIKLQKEGGIDPTGRE